MTDTAAAEEAHRILATWCEAPTVPPAWRERMMKAADALPCGCGVPCHVGHEPERLRGSVVERQYAFHAESPGIIFTDLDEARDLADGGPLWQRTITYGPWERVELPDVG